MKHLFKSFITTAACTASLLLINSCHKNAAHQLPVTTAQISAALNGTPAAKGQNMEQILTVAAVRQSAAGSATIMFNRNQQVFSVNNTAITAQLTAALQAGIPVRVTYNPWQATVLEVTALSNSDLLTYTQSALSRSAATNRIITAMKLSSGATLSPTFDNASDLGILNTTTGPGILTPAIPDMATAQLMFNYITKQSCAIPGPYAIDFCISFQYCEDGCYARAHKMCWILNNRYHYATHKVFSFANGGTNSLSVQAQKWGGCCINWWYHVAPLVTINTTTGPKAFVFDPAMFDQPVLLSTWLNAQKNPTCSANAGVDMFNIQPTESYSPSTYSGYTFDTDPLYSSTDSTLVNYSSLLSCP